MKHLIQELKRLGGHTAKGDLSVSTWGDKTCGLEFQQIREVMEWLAAGMLNAGYKGKAHVFWYSDDQTDASYAPGLKAARREPGPTFLYCCGEKKLALPEGFYWRLMTEHPTLRLYQLEMQE